MSKQLEVEILSGDDATECTCPLCGKSLALSCFVGMLYDGGQPLGCICERCLEESPKQVAGRLRERVVDLYAFIQKAQESLSGEAWSRCIEKVHSRACESRIGYPSLTRTTAKDPAEIDAQGLVEVDLNIAPARQFRSIQGPATVYPQAGNPAEVLAQHC